MGGCNENQIGKVKIMTQMLGVTTLGSVTKDEEIKIKPAQPQTEQLIANRIFVRFLRWRDNRNLKHEYFRWRTPIEYWDDANMRFNNYRPKPDWKDDWQANTSDITTHAKLMAIVSQQMVNKYRITFMPRLKRDMFARAESNVLQDIYDFTESGSGLGTRNGELDMLITVLQASKEGTVIGFEGYRKTKNWEGIDSRIIPLEDFYPSDMTQFSMEDQQRVIWRSVINKDEFDDKFSKWYQSDKVQIRNNVSQSGNEETSLFNISNTIIDNQVEIIRYFDKLNNEFFVMANGILIVDPNSPGAKLSNIRKDGELGFWKTVFEIYDGRFFYGRSLPDLMKDAQDGIDFLFNAMYDKELLAVMRPILIGGINQIIDDYNRPGEMAQVADINQIKEMEYKGADTSAFRILQQLQDRQSFVSSVDSGGQGIPTGKKTATEVDRAREAARRISTLLGTFIRDGMVQKARLRVGTIKQYLINSEKFQQFTTDNTKLRNGKTGTRTVRLTNQPAPTFKPGVSRKLQEEAKIQEGGIEKNEIFEMTPQKIKDFEYTIKTEAPSQIEEQLKAALGVQFYQVASQRPDQFDPEESARIFAEATKQDYDKVKAKGEQQPLAEEAEEPKVTPSLQSLISQQAT